MKQKLAIIYDELWNYVKTNKEIRKERKQQLYNIIKITINQIERAEHENKIHKQIQICNRTTKQ